MKIPSLCFLFTLLPLAAFAQDDDLVTLSPFEVSSGGNYAPARLRAPQQDTAYPAVSLKRKADYVSVPVSLHCNLRDAAERIAEYRAAVNQIIEAAAKTPNLKVLNGKFSLSAASYGGNIFGAGSSADFDTSIEIYLIGALTGDTSVFDRAAEIKALMDNLKISKRIKLTVGGTSLGVSNPEQYRPELVKQIAADLQMVSSALAGKLTIRVRGLDERVQVRQVDEQNVRIFIPYSYGEITRETAAP